MGFNRDIDATLKEMLDSDKAFKEAFEGKLKSKILDELDNVDFSELVHSGIRDMINYMFTSDDYIYEEVRNNVCEELSNRVKVVIRSDEDEKVKKSNNEG